MKTVAVTGSAGFLGTHLVLHLLSCGHRVKAVSRKTITPDHFQWLLPWYSGADLNNLVFAKADILDPADLEDAFRGCDAVFHCAAMISFHGKDAEAMLETNVNGTANVVNACLRAGVKDLIHASSVAALGRTVNQLVITEDAEWTDSGLNTDYAISKHLAENEVWRGMEEGLNVAMVLPGIILGPHPGETGSGMIFQRAATGSRVYPSGTNGFVGVSDVARLMEILWAKGLWGTRVLAVSENISYKSLLTSLSELLGKPAPDIRIPAKLARFAARIFSILEKTGIPTPYPSHGLISTSANTVYESRYIKNIQGFEFTPVNKTLEQSISLLREAKKLPV